MSPGIRIITQLDLPLVVPKEVVKCPKCGREVVIRGVMTDGMLDHGCKSEPAFGTRKWLLWDRRCYQNVDWVPTNKMLIAWFNSHFKYKALSTETIKKKRRLKYRRG